ncbi:tyrosine-type recombinase/integrase [Enterococcus sp. CWB-B31]|uniref:tyrosine-type recombinase/integrase n=1 Tax=Enterococcus sp. CWB-B31 TaxID=2885159 RepID=UPI001E31CEAD|nr:site-specific integrase [Enterococcus sp. CWB-B31]MCB5955572.1 site-specific integrase [Enterococcus sp. CWB-B31]
MNQFYSKTTTLADYFLHWMQTFRKPVVSYVTYVKYQNTHRQIQEFFGEKTLETINRVSYQKVLNEYAKTHSKLTTACFHKQIRASLLDAVDEQIILVDPTRKAIVTGKNKVNRKSKYLNLADWQKIVNYTSENLTANNMNLIIYLSAVTGMRYAEVLGLTWNDIHFKSNQIHVNKTWDYKYHTGFQATKNYSSIRFIDIDEHTVKNLALLYKNEHTKLNSTQLICANSCGSVPASMTINRYLQNLCQKLEIDIISFHGLRHTHASILLFKGVNIMTVSRRLGHSNTTTTQAIYLHLIREMEARETDLVLGFLNEALA